MTGTEGQPPPALNTAAPRRPWVLDRYLPVWVLAAMAAGLLLGHSDTGHGPAVVAGLLLAVSGAFATAPGSAAGAPPARVLAVSSVVLNWVFGPLVMFSLAWTLLPGLPEYRTGVILLGLLPCVTAAVIRCTCMAGGDRTAAAALVLLHALVSFLAFGVLAWFYLDALPGWLDAGGNGEPGVPVGRLARSVAAFLGAALVAGYLVHRFDERRLARAAFEARVLRPVGTLASLGVPFAVLLLFARHGETVTDRSGDVLRVAAVLLLHLTLMWFGAFALGKSVGLTYARTAALAFAAAGSGGEVATAVAVVCFGAASRQALSGGLALGVTLPVLTALVAVSRGMRRRYPQPPDVVRTARRRRPGPA